MLGHSKLAQLLSLVSKFCYTYYDLENGGEDVVRDKL